MENSINVLTLNLTTYSNKLFETGSFPDEWSGALIQPLFKKGDVNCPEIYRGVSLLNISEKLYGYILNKRLSKWIEENSLLSETQAGFKKQQQKTNKQTNKKTAQ